MDTDDRLQELEAKLAAQARRNRTWNAAAALVLLVLFSSLAWYAHNRIITVEQELATAIAERDEAVATAQQRQALLDQAETERRSLDAERLELKQRLPAVLDELARLEAEVADRPAQMEQSQEITTAQAEGESTMTEAAEEETLPAEVTPTPPATEPPPATTASASVATAEPAPEASVDSLIITFEMNSSYLPASLNGQLRQLASRLERDKTYEVAIIGSVGTSAAGERSEQGRLAYDRWLAERRMNRVAEYLRKNAKAKALTIKQDFALNDPSRRVVVQVRPAS